MLIGANRQRPMDCRVKPGKHGEKCIQFNRSSPNLVADPEADVGDAPQP